MLDENLSLADLLFEDAAAQQSRQSYSMPSLPGSDDRVQSAFMANLESNGRAIEDATKGLGQKHPREQVKVHIAVLGALYNVYDDMQKSARNPAVLKMAKDTSAAIATAVRSIRSQFKG